MTHKLVDGTLKREADGIVARCTCGWSSSHFTSFSASAAFIDHQEAAAMAQASGQSNNCEQDEGA